MKFCAKNRHLRQSRKRHQKYNNIMRNFRPMGLFLQSDEQKSRRAYIDIGEFLPPESNGYKGIARILLASTTGDVISIRVKRTKSRFKISVKDEYGTVYSGYKSIYKLLPTQGEIFDVIKYLEEDESKCLTQYIEYNDLKTIDDIKNFIYLESEIYPNLNDLFIDYLKQL
jgi:hypothetical protein